MTTRVSTAARDGLPQDHPTAVMFLDETGAIAKDRFFAVGCLKLDDPAQLLRAVQKLRDRFHFYQEIHWVDLTKKALPFYGHVVDLIVGSNARFSCFVSDRSLTDPVARFGSPWAAYEKLATQLHSEASALVKWWLSLPTITRPRTTSCSSGRFVLR